MVANRFGRLRIITNTAILTVQLGPTDLLPAGRELPAPASVDMKSFTFGEMPKIVVPGPDRTLYIAKQGTAAQGIFALNPDVGELDASGKVVHPEKLWEVATNDENTTRITLSPDGHFLYALARFTGKKSRFIAINAQTGEDFQLLPRKVNLSGNTVTWVSGMKFDSTAVGRTAPFGFLQRGLGNAVRCFMGGFSSGKGEPIRKNRHVGFRHAIRLSESGLDDRYRSPRVHS
jgi:hypothetical protein